MTTISNLSRELMTRAAASARTCLALCFVIGQASAHAACLISVATFNGGTFGATAVGANSCGLQPVAGGTGQVQAASSRPNSSASADLGTGVLTVRSPQPAGLPSANMWDTLTFNGLPAEGALLTEVLALNGSITGMATGFAQITVGDPGTTSIKAKAYLDSSSTLPSTLSLQFAATNGVPVLIDASLQGNNFLSFAGAAIDLADPPTLSILVPAGVSYTSASGVFANVSAVPEPHVAFMLLAGLAMLARRNGRRPSAEGR